MPRALGQIDARKHQAILNAASEVLAERGFGASIEEVARRAGVSKQTIYNHYHSKTELVRVIVERRSSIVTAPLKEAPPEQPAEVTLAQYATAILHAMLLPASQQLMRMAISSTIDMPELARAIYDAGIGAASRHLADYLAGRPELDVENPRRAADVFVGMATGRLQTRLLMGVESGFEPDQVQARAAEAAMRFVKAYRRSPTP
jgi:AcrR family transcriptional regulator